MSQLSAAELVEHQLSAEHAGDHRTSGITMNALHRRHTPALERNLTTATPVVVDVTGRREPIACALDPISGFRAEPACAANPSERLRRSRDRKDQP
jgi:hypothetical protein